MTLTQLQKILEDAAAFCDTVYTGGIEEESARAFDLYEKLDNAAGEVADWIAQSEDQND